ncbi:hypothetical protein PYCCODRAFT_48858 [Trametes coccinea BRFM310]|uniref:Uncharacterized protein n=1 Tax=Trametes coccinea (strain BRFM310) TaxID=1353009 RepID=A0A1Y2J5T5_TRAC3|nr:hypothetical protein PYCCODRAFT_48858 [Trametes coccinea BRFM310]
MRSRSKSSFGKLFFSCEAFTALALSISSLWPAALPSFWCTTYQRMKRNRIRPRPAVRCKVPVLESWTDPTCLAQAAPDASAGLGARSLPSHTVHLTITAPPALRLCSTARASATICIVFVAIPTPCPLSNLRPRHCVQCARPYYCSSSAAL